MSRAVIGIDCGGTRARAVVLDGADEVLARAEGPGAVASATDPQAAAQAVASVCRDAAAAAGVELPVDAVWAGITGAGREASRSIVEDELTRAGVARSVRVGTDVQAAFHDAFGDGPGILLIAGTGSIAYGRAGYGRQGRAGGWGHLIGDEGSGYAIGLEGLQLMAQAMDGRGPQTTLPDRIFRHLRLGAMDDVVTWVASASKGEVAALAPVVVAAAAEGDTVAGKVVDRAVQALERHIRALLERLGPWSRPPTIALAGGLLRPGRPLRESLERLLVRHLVSVLGRDLDPALGAAKLGSMRGEGRI
jgi:glucosamine kinase